MFDFFSYLQVFTHTVRGEVEVSRRIKMSVLFIQYFLISFVVVLASIKISECVDEIDQQTNLGGALIGGVLLAGVTSLPEFITSLSSTIMLDNPDLAFGNILGSNAFNVFILAAGNIFFFKHRIFNQITAINTKTCLLVIFIYMLILSSFHHVSTVSFAHVGIPTIMIFVLYCLNITSSSSEENVATSYSNSNKKRYNFTWLAIRFIFWAVVIVIASLLVSVTTDKIAQATSVGSSFVGAIFLGVATSLPETASLISLVRLRNYDMAVGNIVGSNLFNFGILAITDLFYFSNNIFAVADTSNMLLGVVGVLQVAVLVMMLLRGKVRGAVNYIWPSFMIVLMYSSYIFISLQ